MTDRERLARLIDPEAEGLRIPYWHENHRLKSAREAADRIIADGWQRRGRGSLPNSPTTKVKETIDSFDGEFSVDRLKQALPDMESKTIYNAVGYLCRHGVIRKIGYGRYRA